MDMTVQTDSVNTLEDNFATKMKAYILSRLSSPMRNASSKAIPLLFDLNNVPVEESKEEIIEGSPLLAAMQKQAPLTPRPGSPLKYKFDKDDEIKKFESLVSELKHLSTNEERAKRDLASLIKIIPKEVYESVSNCTNINAIINNLTSNIYKIQRQYYKEVLNNESNKKPLAMPQIRISSDRFNELQRSIDYQWTEQFHRSTYYSDGPTECISRWMQRMMKNKTSFWFDQPTYDLIRKDYEAVRKDYNNYVQDKGIGKVTKERSISPGKRIEIKIPDKEDMEESKTAGIRAKPKRASGPVTKS